MFKVIKYIFQIKLSFYNKIFQPEILGWADCYNIFKIIKNKFLSNLHGKELLNVAAIDSYHSCLIFHYHGQKFHSEHLCICCHFVIKAFIINVSPAFSFLVLFLSTTFNYLINMKGNFLNNNEERRTEGSNLKVSVI